MNSPQAPKPTRHANFFMTTIAASVAALMFAAPHEDPAAAAYEKTMAAVTKDLCSESLVFLGEPAHHGSSEAIQLKSALARHLIEQCRFDTIIFESSMPEFIDLERRAAKGEDLSPQQIDDAVGGIWSWTEEFQPFAQFLSTYRRDHRLLLAGIDDQLTTATAHFAPSGLSTELSSYLPPAARARCEPSLRKRLNQSTSYDNEHPYDANEKKVLTDCLESIDQQFLLRNSAEDRYARAMTASLERYVGRDFVYDNDSQGGSWARDRSLFLNLQWQLARMPSTSKAIVWAATTHLARPTDRETAAAATHHSMGGWVALETDLHPKIIAFSALGGTFGRKEPAPLPVAPEDSLEARALKDPRDRVAYVDAAALQRAGKSNARGIGAAVQELEWFKAIDGLVVVREDGPVHLSKK